MEVLSMTKKQRPLSNKELLYAIMDLLEVLVVRMSKIGHITIISPEPIDSSGEELE